MFDDDDDIDVFDPSKWGTTTSSTNNSGTSSSFSPALFDDEYDRDFSSIGAGKNSTRSSSSSWTPPSTSYSSHTSGTIDNFSTKSSSSAALNTASSATSSVDSSFDDLFGFDDGNKEGATSSPGGLPTKMKLG